MHCAQKLWNVEMFFRVVFVKCVGPFPLPVTGLKGALLRGSYNPITHCGNSYCKGGGPQKYVSVMAASSVRCETANALAWPLSSVLFGHEP